MLSPRRCNDGDIKVAAPCPDGSLLSPAINDEKLAPPTRVVSSIKDDDDSCMDLCSSSDDDSCEERRAIDNNNIENNGNGKKRSPVKSTQLQKKLKFASGIFATPLREKCEKAPSNPVIDLCLSSEGEEEAGQKIAESVDNTKSFKSEEKNRLSRKRKIFDEVYRVDKGADSYNWTSMASSTGTLLSGSTHVHTPSCSRSKNDMEWREFGIFDKNFQSNVMLLTDTSLEFSPSELSFFNNMKLSTTADLTKADTNFLSTQLLHSANFKKACAFYAWKDGKPLRDFMKFKVARNTVLKWKRRVEVKEEVTDENESLGDVKAEDVSLTDILSSKEAKLLHDHCGIETATQLITAEEKLIMQKLSRARTIVHQFEGRSARQIEFICEGMLFSWLLRAREAIENTDSTATTMEADTSESEDDEVHVSSEILTPLSYVDYLFCDQEGISSDHELSRIDPSLLSRSYTAFLHTKGHDITYIEAHMKMSQLRHEASLVISGAPSTDNSSQTSSRLDVSTLPKGVMLNASNLCTKVFDEHKLPKKTIFTYDDQNFILYEFLVSINDSLIPNSGKGAFLTFKGAKVLKKSSKCKGSLNKLGTRNPREAHFASSGATVSLRGEGLREYSSSNEIERDDFVDAKGLNITFSSKHVGCALIELDRYAPVLPADRKTEFLFCMKDFVFCHEPQSWRFDVKEKLNGEKQVVDFTSDSTGSPHDAARANVAMYVNEVGHDIDLVENIVALETCRSVSYYIYIDRPMKSGETRELLINYREGYEEMRVRRGYGLSNIHNGIKGDEDDTSRVLRNHNERIQIEATLLSSTEDEIGSLVKFIKERVLDGVIEPTSGSLLPGVGVDKDIISRQYVARRRIHWLSKLCERRLVELIGNQGEISPSDDNCMYYNGLIVFVHGWMVKDDPRPPYSGLATVTSISKDHHGRHRFELSLPHGKYLSDVPAAVVTLPDDADLVDAPQRLRLSFMKSQKDHFLPQRRNEILRDLASIQDLSLSQKFPPSNSIRKSLEWELAEEILFRATKDETLTHSLHELLSKIAGVIDCEDTDNLDSLHEKLYDVVGLKRTDKSSFVT